MNTPFTSSVLALMASASLLSCHKEDKKGSSANLPYVTPTVKAAAPTGLQTALVGDAAQGFAERFFNAEGGPSNIFNLLAVIDQAVASINTVTAADVKACRDQNPVSYIINPAGHNVEMLGQCSQTLAAGAVAKTSGFNLYGVKDGVIYLYSYINNNHLAAVVTPIAGSDKYTVKAWFSVGNMGTEWKSQSYGLMSLSANGDTKAFEFAVAGSGLGYCGAQLRSDGTGLFATTSVDMGETCVAAENTCVKAADLSASSECSEPIQTFDLVPMGRKAVDGTPAFGESQYPQTANITLDGTESDSLHFGPSSIPTGIGSLD